MFHLPYLRHVRLMTDIWIAATDYYICGDVRTGPDVNPMCYELNSNP